MVDLVMRVDRSVEVVFLNTGFHFAETLEVVRRVEDQYGTNVIRLQPERAAATYPGDGVGACCKERKVRPLDSYLRGKRAWITGVRRTDSATRALIRSLEWDARRGLVKVNPIFAWSDLDVANYIAEHDVIVNPLRNQGYGSIGCEPCTSPSRGRDGRWPGSDRIECGLHAH